MWKKNKKKLWQEEWQKYDQKKCKQKKNTSIYQFFVLTLHHYFLILFVTRFSIIEYGVFQLKRFWQTRQKYWPLSQKFCPTGIRNTYSTGRKIKPNLKKKKLRNCKKKLWQKEWQKYDQKKYKCNNIVWDRRNNIAPDGRKNIERDRAINME